MHEERQPGQGSVDGSGGGPEGGEQEVPPEPPPDQLRGGGPEGHERQGAPGPGYPGTGTLRRGGSTGIFHLFVCGAVIISIYYISSASILIIPTARDMDKQSPLTCYGVRNLIMIMCNVLQLGH